MSDWLLTTPQRKRRANTMISQDVLNETIRELEKFYGINLSAFVVEVWNQYFQENNISNEELLEGLKQAITTQKYCPTPEWLVSVSKSSEHTLANSEWQKIVNNAPDHVKDALTISARGRKALKLIGGLQAVRDCDVQFLDAKRKSFVELWKEKDTEVESLIEIRTGNLRALPPAKVDYVAMLKEIVAAEQAEAAAARAAKATEEGSK